MTPEFFREQQLMRGAVGRGTANVVTPATVFLSQTFTSVTPDIAAGGSVFVAPYEIARSGDTSAPVTVGVALTGRAPAPLVAGDVQGGLSDVTYTIPAGQSRLPLSISFPAQDLTVDHFGRVQLHGASVPIVGNGRFDFTLAHNTANPPVGNYALSPDYTARAAKHQAGGADSSVVQLAAGLGAQLKGGSVVGDDTNGLALWFTRRTTLDWDMSFTTKKLDATTPTSGALTEELMLVYFGCTGNGGSFPADVSAWPATTNPWSHNYRANLKGAAITLYNQTDASATVAHAVALGIFKGDDTRTNVAPATGTLFPFVQNTVYTWTIRRRGETVSVSATDGATTWSDSFTAPSGTTLATYADAGNIGLLVSAQRQVEVGDLTVTDGIAGTPPYALAPDWTQKWVQHATPTGVVRQLAAGVELAAGNAITDDNATLVSKDIHTAGGAAAAAAAAPLAGWTAAADLMLASNPNYHPIRNVADLATLGTMHADHQYVVLNNIDLGGRTFNLDGGNGGAGHEAYLRGATAGRDHTLYPVLSNGRLQAKGQNIVIRELGLDNVPIDLGQGCSKLQIESNWFSGMDTGYADGFVAHDGVVTVRDVLVAFNRYQARGAGRISSCILLLLGPHHAGQVLLTTLPIAGIRVYANIYHTLRFGPDHLTSGGNSGSSRYLMLGDNPWGDFLDTGGIIDRNLFYNHRSAGPICEFKIVGWTYTGNTVEAGDLEPNPWAPKKTGACMEVRFRNSRLTKDPNTPIDTGRGNDVVGNLWVARTSQDKNGNIAVRDGFHNILNNWGIILGPGVQPPAWAAATFGGLTMEINNGPLDWRTYPAGRTAGGGQEWENCGKLKIGGNLADIRVGIPSTAPPDFKTELCRIAPGGGSRGDRNHAMAIDTAVNIDQTTPVTGASVLQVPHRMQAAENGFAGTPEVGPAAWNAAAYGSGPPGSGDLDVSFDYTCTATPAATDGNGCASLFYCHMVGQGAYPADMSAWSSAQWGAAGDTEYQPNANFFRFTFNTLNTVTPAISNKARLVVVSGGVLTRPSPNEAAADFFFPVGTKYRLRCQKNGNDFSFTQTDAAGNVKTQTWTDATAGAMNTGNFLWRFQPARHGKIENLTVA
jgi:hypothetical protein